MPCDTKGSVCLHTFKFQTKVLRPIKSLKYSNEVKELFTGFIVFLIVERILNSILADINVISSGVVVNKPNCRQLRLNISMLKSSVVGLRIPSLAVQNGQLAVVCGLFTECLPEDSIISILNSCR